MGKYFSDAACLGSQCDAGGLQAVRAAAAGETVPPAAEGVPEVPRVAVAVRGLTDVLHINPAAGVWDELSLLQASCSHLPAAEWQRGVTGSAEAGDGGSKKQTEPSQGIWARSPALLVFGDLVASAQSGVNGKLSESHKT